MHDDSRFFKRLLRGSRPLLTACLIGSIPVNAHALGFGEIQVQSFLGEPFAGTITVLGDDARETSSSCFSVVREKFIDPDNLPLLPGIQIELQRNVKGGFYLVLRSKQPVNEPMARVAVQAGCGTSLSREYVVMLSPRVYEEALSSAIARSVPTTASASEPSVASGDSGGVSLPTGAAAPALRTGAAGSGTTGATPPKPDKPKSPVAPKASSGTPKAAPQKTPSGDRLVVATPTLGTQTTPQKNSNQINLTEKRLADANRQVGTLKAELDRIEETRQKEIQSLQALEVHVISLQKQMEDLQLQIKHKEALERKLLAKLNEPKMQLFVRDEAGNSTDSPTEFLWMILIVIGIGAATAVGTFAALKRQQRNHWG